MEDSKLNSDTNSPICLSNWSITRDLGAVNEDYHQRIVNLPTQANWQSTSFPGLEVRVLEHIPGDNPRLTAQIKLNSERTPCQLLDSADLEILVQQGELESALGIYPAGMYLRLPTSGPESLHPLSLHPSTTTFETTPSRTKPTTGTALLYLAVSQMLGSDSEQRLLDTAEESHWLPGPTDGTEVLPLHGHGTGNVMLIRWTASAAFKPGLDPRGDEVLVLKGTLHDSHGQYPEGTWIRNPVETWQSWGANAGTLVYYKNGQAHSVRTRLVALRHHGHAA